MALSNQILQGCLNQDRTCQEIVYKKYYGMLVTVGMRYFQDLNDAKVLVNEAFFKIFTKIDSYNTSIPFESWITRIMVNTSIDYWRKIKKVKFNEKNVPEYFDEPMPNSSGTIAEKIEAEYLIQLLQQVPEVSKKVFLLFAVEGFSHREISEILKINEGTSKWHVNNARKILKELILNSNKQDSIYNSIK